MYRKRKQGRLNRKVAHTGISLLHFPSALPEPALPPLLRTTLRAGGDTLSHLISFLYHRWCAVRPGASEAPRLRAETHSGVQARPYGRGISLMRRRKAAAEPGVAGGHFALRASRLHPHSSTGLRPWPPAESGESLIGNGAVSSHSTAPGICTEYPLNQHRIEHVAALPCIVHPLAREVLLPPAAEREHVGIHNNNARTHPMPDHHQIGHLRSPRKHRGESCLYASFLP